MAISCAAPLLRRLGLGGRLGTLFLALVPVVLALELLDPAGGVHVLHLAGEERVAGRADFDGDVLLRAARDELVAAAAGHGRLDVLGMNPGFHGNAPLLNYLLHCRKGLARAAR